jgi:predicted nuclease with TOPRIM domain
MIENADIKIAVLQMAHGIRGIGDTAIFERLEELYISAYNKGIKAESVVLKGKMLVEVEDWEFKTDRIKLLETELATGKEWWNGLSDDNAKLRDRIKHLEHALRKSVHAMRAPLDDWKGHVEREALDAAHQCFIRFNPDFCPVVGCGIREPHSHDDIDGPSEAR